jgi:undecaprenyl diphosphate synthase
MDGNGRWAAARGLSRSEGHKAGAAPVRAILKEARAAQVQYLTLYAFSTENWRRAENEIQNLFELLIQYLDAETAELLSSGVRLNAVGDLARLPQESRAALDLAMEVTRANGDITLTLALSYGSRAEIVAATRALALRARQGLCDPQELTEELFARELWTGALPDVDLLIRTGGEKRISNFLLWKLAYAELYFTDRLWPDFGTEDFRQALSDFQGRRRRFGRAV